MRILRRSGSFGDLLAGARAVMAEGAQPDRAGRLPVLLVSPTPVYIEPDYLEPAEEDLR